jgi:hypothetical protein
MVDVARSKAQLLVLYADNSVGAISPQDLRDFVESAAPPYGSFSTNVAAATTLTQDVYSKMAGTTTAGDMNQFDMPVDGRLRYTGVPNRHMHIAVTTSFTCANNNKVIGLKIAKNGTVLDDTIARRKVSTGADIGSTALHGDVMLSTNDYLELFLTNETDSTNATIENVYFFAVGMLM